MKPLTGGEAIQALLGDDDLWARLVAEAEADEELAAIRRVLERPITDEADEDRCWFPD